jgi:hypothetical protein
MRHAEKLEPAKRVVDRILSNPAKGFLFIEIRTPK